MKYTKTTTNQLKAKPRRCIRYGEMTIFTCTKIEELKGKPLCPECEADLLKAKKRTDRTIRADWQAKNERLKQVSKTRNARGSNQYMTRAKQRRVNWMLTAITFLLAILLFLMLNGILNPTNDEFLSTKAEAAMLSPYVEQTTALTATSTPSVQQEPAGGEEAQIVREIFGDHADKAFQVLGCENSTLNPKAVNTAGNTPAGSRDIGVFQINEYWQGVHSKFLFDARTNITMAWQIYRDSGYSFRMWTCGRKLGL